MSDYSGLVAILLGFLMFPAPLALLLLTGDYSPPETIVKGMM